MATRLIALVFVIFAWLIPTRVDAAPAGPMVQLVFSRPHHLLTNQLFSFQLGVESSAGMPPVLFHYTFVVGVSGLRHKVHGADKVTGADIKAVISHVTKQGSYMMNVWSLQPVLPGTQKLFTVTLCSGSKAGYFMIIHFEEVQLMAMNSTSTPVAITNFNYGIAISN